jgi:tetraacyldisaccharide 4'-kinase
VRARRWWAWPLVPLYWAGLRVKDGLRRVGVLRVRRLGWPVVSVGSLSAGGAGKTPVVMALAELLTARGWRVDVLSRGYGRESGEQPHDNLAARGDHGAPGVERVDLRVADAAGRFGDEPVLIARRTGVPVWVGADRYAAGALAEGFGGREGEADSSAALRNDKGGVGDGVREADSFAALRNDKPGLRDDELRCVHLLDDGFQHRELARAVDVLLVTTEDLEDALLPAGNLREGLWALRRADVVVVREEERERVEPILKGGRLLIRNDALIWTVRRHLRIAATADAGRAQGVRWLAFCAIARPDGFRAMLVEAGYGLVETICFADHHPYRMEDIERLMESAKRLGATGFVATEKDQVKLSVEMLQRLEAIGPVEFARLEVTFLEEERVVRELEARIG